MMWAQAGRGPAFVPPLLAIVFVVVAGVGGSRCGRTLTLQHTVESPEALARAVLVGLKARDVAALERLALTQDEFERLVWPRLPTSRPGRNVPWDYVWNDLHGKSVMQLRARLNEWQDDGYTVVRVEFTGETTDYETFRVRRDSAITLRGRNGQETRARLFGSLIEQHGRVKVFSYVVD